MQYSEIPTYSKATVSYYADYPENKIVKNIHGLLICANEKGVILADNSTGKIIGCVFKNEIKSIKVFAEFTVEP